MGKSIRSNVLDHGHLPSRSVVPCSPRALKNGMESPRTSRKLKHSYWRGQGRTQKLLRGSILLDLNQVMKPLFTWQIMFTKIDTTLVASRVLKRSFFRVDTGG